MGNIYTFIFTAIFIAIGSVTYSQQSVRIAYGDSLQVAHYADDFTFYIDKVDKGGAMRWKIDGSKFSHHIFKTPGRYQIHLSPKSSEKMTTRTHHDEEYEGPKDFEIIVDSVRVIYDATSMKLSHPIYMAKETKDIILTIEATIENYYQRPVLWDRSAIKTAGIETKIIANPIQSPNIYPLGKQILHYQLHGICTQNSYIQFDFADHNGTIIPISLTSPISNP